MDVLLWRCSKLCRWIIASVKFLKSIKIIFKKGKKKFNFNSQTCLLFFPLEYSCHGTWVENDTAYLVASTETGRYCLVYSLTTSTTATSPLRREFTITGHMASCPRAAHFHKHEWQVNLTAYGKKLSNFAILIRYDGSFYAARAAFDMYFFFLFCLIRISCWIIIFVVIYLLITSTRVLNQILLKSYYWIFILFNIFYTILLFYFAAVFFTFGCLSFEG